MVLERMVEYKSTEIERRRKERPLESFRANLELSDRSLYDALRKKNTGFILECKKASPSKGLLRADFEPAAIARQYADVADAISVLCDNRFFQGRLEYLREVRKEVRCPVLCKDIVVHPYQLYEARYWGADAVLLMLSVLDRMTLLRCLEIAETLSMDALVEIHDEKELELALDCNASLIGINNRNLKTLEVDLQLTEKLSPLVPDNVLSICESGIRDHRDIVRLRHLVDGFLVGSSLMQQKKVNHAARRLVFGRVKVCGLTNKKDALVAYQTGASWGGMIFADSPRKIDQKIATPICRTVDLNWAGVFVNQDPKYLAKLVFELGLDAVQLHGDETFEYVQKLRRLISDSCAIWKAWRVFDSVPDIDYTGADRLLLDTFVKGRYGGTGKTFDWDLFIKHEQSSEFILSGGLISSNVASADKLGAWALDVNSGVERTAGKKSKQLLGEFFSALKGSGRLHSGVKQ